MLALARERGGDVDNPDKRHPLDFVLWQPSAPDEPSWDTMWGPGRPGWHIECSALALRELGTTIDLHGGGTDLIFPHHECERAQSEAATGEPFVRHWMHTALISKDGAEDVEEPRQPRVRRRPAQGVGPDGDPPRRSSSTTTAREWEWDDELMPRSADAARRVAAAPPAGGRRRARRRCGPPSTTTSTPRGGRRHRRRRRARRRRPGRGRAARRRLSDAAVHCSSRPLTRDRPGDNRRRTDGAVDGGPQRAPARRRSAIARRRSARSPGGCGTSTRRATSGCPTRARRSCARTTSRSSTRRS